MESFIAAMMMFGGNFAPRAWAMCNGQLLAISTNTALFSLVGTIYGGDGRTTFGLPDLRGRAPIGFGSGPGLPNHSQGQRVGQAIHTLTNLELANHTHVASVSGLTVGGTINVTEETANANDPAGAYLATTTGNRTIYHTTRTGTATLASDALTITGSGGTVTVEPTGASQPFSLMQPSLALNFIICLQGIFPSRN